MMEDFQLDGSRSENIVEDSLFGAEEDAGTDNIHEDIDSLKAGVSIEYLTDLKDHLKLEIDAHGLGRIKHSFTY